MSRRPSTRHGGAAILTLSATLLASCSTPLHLWDTHITSTPHAASLDVSALEREPVAILGLVAPAGLQGLSASVGHALAAALEDISPPLRVVPIYETMSRLNEQGLAAEYADLVSGFARSGILERKHLGRIGSALGARYVLQPGLGAFTETLADKFEIAGWKLIRTRITTLRLWLQLWDTETGRMLWESGAEATDAAQLLTQESTVSLEKIAGRLWVRMIQDSLLEGRTTSRSSSGH
jgi:hypothetical protein